MTKIFTITAIDMPFSLFFVKLPIFFLFPSSFYCCMFLGTTIAINIICVFRN